MKLSISQHDLKEGLNIVGAAVAGNTTIPVLSGVLLEVSENVLRLSTSDLEKDITTTLKCQGEDGAIVLPYKLLNDLVGSLNGPIEMNLNLSNLTVKWESGQQKGSIKGLDPELFPDIKWSNGDKFDVTFEGEELAEIIARVGVSSGADSGREWLDSVNLRKNEGTNGNLLFQAANGFKASFQNIDGSCPDCEVIVPIQNMTRVAQLAAKSKEVGLIFQGPDVLFTFDQSVWLRSSTIEAKYPDLSVLLPKSTHTKVTMDKEAFLGKIKTAKLFCSETNLISINLNPDGVTVKAWSAELGDYSSTVQPVAFEGEPLEIYVNSAYFAQGIFATPGDQVVIGATNAESIIMISPVEDTGFVFCTTPMHVTK